MNLQRICESPCVERLLCIALLCLPVCAGYAAEDPQGVDSDSFRPFVFLHFGDPQIADDSHKQRFAEAVRQANQLEPDFVVIVGDLVSSGKDEEWAAFDEVLKQFKVPVKLIPGNHDFNDMEGRNKYVAKYGEGFHVMTYNNCCFLFLDWMLTTPAFENEPIAAEQWKFIQSTLEEADRKKRDHIFIVTHCPPYYKNGENQKDNGFTWPIPHRKRLLSLVRKHNVKTFVCGHLHSTRVVPADDDAFTMYIAGGTAFLFDRPEIFGYGIFKVEKDKLTHTYVDLNQPLEKTKEILKSDASAP